MGRDVAGLRIDKKPNVKSNSVVLDRVHVAPRISTEEVENKEQEPEDHNPKGTSNEKSQEKQDVLGVKSTNTGPGVPEVKTKVEPLKPSEKKSSSPVKPAPEVVAIESLQTNSPTTQSPELLTENRASPSSDVSGVESFPATVSPSSTSDLHSPLTTKKPQPNSPSLSRKPLQLDSDSKYHDEEDNYSLASSAATSIRSARSKVTVPVAPKFISGERAARRKEYYMKLEEKQKALDAEKLEYAARIKEEEEAAIKKLRKTMVVKANPVPSFYRQGPPRKVELKKLPVTRPKSPNLTRRKSLGDAGSSTPDDKTVCTRVTRHSIGVCKDSLASPSIPKNKDLSRTRNVNGPKFKGSSGAGKVKASPEQVKEREEAPETQKEQISTDIRVVAETKSSDATKQQSAEDVVPEKEIKSGEISVIDEPTKTSDEATGQAAAEVAVQE